MLRKSLIARAAFAVAGLALAGGLAVQFAHKSGVAAAPAAIAAPAASRADLSKCLSNAAAATGTTLTATAIGKPVRVEQPGYHANLTFTVRSIGRVVGTSVRPSQGTWVAVGVEAANTGCPAVVDPEFLALRTLKGHIYPPTVLGNAGEFTNTLLADDAHTSGLVFFDVPPSALRGAVITVSYRSATAGFWRFPDDLPTVTALP